MARARRRSLLRSIMMGCAWGVFAGLVTAVFVYVNDGWDDGPLHRLFLGAAVSGVAFGAVVGTVRHGILAIAGPGVDEVSTPPPLISDDPWGEPVARCERSAEAVVRLLDTLPASAAAEWLTRIAESMAEKLAELGTLADAGRAAVPIEDKKSITLVRKHPLYAMLEKSADEFADISDQVGRMMVELHDAPDLDQVRAQLEVLTEQLPWLRPAA